jgi:hypothetical protein
MEALRTLAELLRSDDTVITPHVTDTAADPVLGRLVASGPRASSQPEDYALVVEAVREGYLLHYGSPRIVKGVDADLALLAGDYLYATGLERLSALGDPEAVAELSDLISLSAQIHADAASAHPDGRLADALWLAATVAVGAGPSDEHAEAKRIAREGSGDAAAALWRAAESGAADGSMQAALEAAREAIGFAAHDLG